MSRFKRKGGKGGKGKLAKRADLPVPTSEAMELTDVTIVKRPKADKTAVLAELSAAFETGSDSVDPTTGDRSGGWSGGGIVDATPGDETPGGVTPADPAPVDATPDRSAAAARIGDLDDSSSDDTAPSIELVATEQKEELTTIAIGDHDDQPDAIYLDEETGIMDSSGTVFIDDDGTGDAVLPKDATGRGIEPRLRQRRIGVRRAEGRRRLRWMALVGVVVVIGIATLAALGSSLFAIDSVDVTGRRNADAAAVDAVVEDLLDTPVLLADTDAAERQLESIAWVESARVRTDFPDSATIELRERTPVATVRGNDGDFRILDEAGRVLDVIPGQPIEFVLITGPPIADLVPGQFADSGLASAAAIVPKLGVSVRSRLVSMSTTPDGSDLRFVLTNEAGANLEVRLGAAISDNDQVERLVRLELVLDDVIGPETTVIDVSTNETTDR